MSKFYSAETQQGHSSHFIQYIRKISEATSKQEEDQLVEEDLKELKVDLTSSTANDEQLLKEYAVRAYYAELLGHSAEFAYIHCINLSCHSKLLFKRTGYLATKLMVNPESELMYLIVSSIQRDLKSPNHLEVAAALTAAAQMLRPELMTVVQGDLPGLMTHEKPLVRRKVVEAMHAFYARSDTAIGDVVSFRQALCDRDPSVMDAATRLLHDVIQRSPDAHRDLLDSFVMILSQVIERRLPRTYDYHRTPAPWLQIRVIQLLTILIGNDPQRVQKAAHVLEEAMQRADNGKLIGFAIICELVRTAASIPPLPTLLSLAAEAVSGLITARNPSLRCAGIQALSYMVRVKPELAVEHQEVVMSCLEDADETIRRKSIWLLFAICDSDNIGPIARRLTRFLSKVSDPFLKRSTTRSLCRLMEQYATSPWWYIRTMNSVLAVAAECVLPTTIQRMLKLIAEGQGVDDEADTNFRTRCVETYFAITGGASPSSSSCSVDVAGGAAAGAALSSPGAHSVHDVRGAAGSSSSSSTSAIPEVLCRIGAWVMGEYGFLTSKISGDMLLDRLCDLMEQTEDGETRCWILTAIMKVTTQTQQRSTGAVIDYADDMAAQYQDSRCIPLQQRCYEFAALRKQPELLRRVLPKDGFCEAMDVDPELHFLDDFMKMAVARGAQRYAAPADVAALRQQHAAAASALHAESALRTAAYVPARSTDIHPVWSASLMGGGTDAGHATSASASSGVVVDSVAVPPNAGLAQSVLQGSERLILQPTATKRWGAQNLREMEAAEEEVHLQVAAAAAVGGGGIVWGADTVRDAPESLVAASFAAGNAAAASSSVGRGAGSAFKESAGDTASTGFGRGRDFTSAGKGKPVSAKNAKFVRSIFGSGRRKGGTKAPSALNAAPAAGATTATTTVLSKHSSPSPQLPASAPVSHKQQQQPFAQASKVMDSLFATDAASTHSSPLSATGEKKTDATMDWFSSSSGGPNVTSISVSRQGTTAAALAALQPPDPAFNTEQFGRTWQAIGISGGRRQRLHFADLSSYAAPDGFLQQYLLQSCSMRVVQIIGKELIAAAQCDAAGGKKAYVLAHLTVANATTLDVEVRAAHRELSEEVLRALKGL